MTSGRRGAAFLELLVVLALAGLVGSIIGITLRRQQQFYRRAAESGFVRESVRDAMEVLSTDIRQMSIGDTIRLMADSSMEFVSTIGTSVVCVATGDEIGLPPTHDSGNSLSSFLTLPDTGDLAVFYSDSIGRWERYRIAGVSPRSLSSSCPVSSGYSIQSDLDAGSAALLLTLTRPLANGIKSGAPIRFLRRARYSLYRAADGDWFLGYRRCNAIGPSVCGAIQPISGPYRAYSAEPRSSGLVFEYFDSAGQRVGAASSFALARVDITARAETEAAAPIDGLTARIADSATITVSVRNRIR
jgi:type II secretory pathway pseudopilin PulG